MGDDASRRLSPISDVYFSKYRQRYFLAGVSCLDYLMLYKKFTYSEEPTYRLDAISQKELGEGKIEYAGSLDDLYHNDRRKYVEYNLMDVELVVKLDKKLQFIELTRGICHIGHVPYEDIVFSSRYLEGAILTYLKDKKLVAPNKPRNAYSDNRTDEDKFIGAYVKEPEPGKYDWIFDLDLTSLYPSIIMSLNLSPETKLVKIGNWSADAFVKNKEHKYRINNDEYSKTDITNFMLQ
jgi:DNA polymerase elongation subunit (family B)